MIAPDHPDDEAKRQAALERYEILDTLPERSYDDITALIARICDTPISLVGLIDRERNWLKSRHGVPLSESPREISFCGHAIVSGEAVFTVEDAREDPRFADNPLVAEHGVVGYAGVPLVDVDGFALGTLCVFHTRPLRLDTVQREALGSMARQVMYLLERHLRERRLEETGRELAARNEELKRFAGAVSHDIKSPVTNIVELARLIGSEAGEALEPESREDLRHLTDASISLRGYVDGLLAHYTADDLLRSAPESFALDELFEAIDRLTVRDARTTLVLPEAAVDVSTHRAALQQVLLNLVANAVRYGSGDSTRVEVRFADEGDRYRFDVVDDGPGIPLERQASIFELFETGGHVGRDGAGGSGIGLATVTKLLERLGGGISLTSSPGRGCTFSVTLPTCRANPIAREAA